MSDPQGAGPKFTPWLCWTLLGLNVAVWLLMVALGVDPMTPKAEQLLDWGGNLGLITIHGEWWRLFTATFIHAGLLHLGFNGYFLWSVGRITEQVFGPLAFTLIYVGSGLVASMISLHWQPDVVSVGASGALFGLFGAFLGFTLRRRDVLPAAFVKSVYKNAGFLVVLNLAIGLSVEGIDLAAHIGGLVAGTGIGWLLARLAEGPAKDREEAKARRRRAVGLTTVATAGVLGLLVAFVPAWDDVFGTLGRYDEVHARALGAYDDAGQDERRSVIEQEVMPAMEELEEMIAELDRVPDRLRVRVDEIGEYTKVRRAAFDAELRGEGEEARRLHAQAGGLWE